MSQSATNATVWYANLPQFSAAMAQAFGACPGIRACLVGAEIRTVLT
jgi:hypothetical protein